MDFGLSVQLKHLVFIGDCIEIIDKNDKVVAISAESFTDFISKYGSYFVSISFDTDYCCPSVYCDFFEWD